MRSGHRGSRGLLAASLLALCLVVALVWVMVIGEGKARRLSLQFDIYRVSADLAEAWLNDPVSFEIQGPILGFAIYDAAGEASIALGSAPRHYDGGQDSGIRLTAGPSGNSLLLTRPLAMTGLRGLGQRRLGMMGGAPFPEPPPGQGPAPAGPGPGGPLALGEGRWMMGGARTLWLEYAQDGNLLQRAFLYLGGATLTLVLLAIYVAILVLYRKNAELREGEARNRELAELGEAARTLVHEIKNPLGIIGIQAATLRKREGAESPAGRTALLIEDEVRRLARMADRIREFLKAGPGEAVELELGAFLLAFAERYAAGPALDPGGSVGPRLLIEGLPPVRAEGPGPLRVKVDPDRLGLALDNLVRNAWEADPAGRVELSLADRGRFARISVGDRGGGVAAEARGRLFEPFFTTKERGSGIGLALARSIARGAGGELLYQERPGGGALFVLELPLLR